MKNTTEYNETFLQGLRDGLPVFLGYFSISIAFGLLSLSSGFSLYEAILMSMIVFAGASQFMAVQMAASGAGTVEIVISTLLVNLRHIIMSSSIKEKIASGPIPPFVIAFGVTDETFSLGSLKKGTLPNRYFFGIEFVSWSGWVLGTVVGVLFGGIIPPLVSTSLGIGLYAMFVVLLVLGVGRSFRALIVALISGGINTLLQHLGLAGGLSIVCAMLGGAFAALFILKEEEGAHE